MLKTASTSNTVKYNSITNEPSNILLLDGLIFDHLRIQCDDNRNNHGNREDQ